MANCANSAAFDSFSFITSYRTPERYRDGDFRIPIFTEDGTRHRTCVQRSHAQATQVPLLLAFQNPGRGIRSTPMRHAPLLFNLRQSRMRAWVGGISESSLNLG